jgi:hypothetical protein
MKNTRGGGDLRLTGLSEKKISAKLKLLQSMFATLVKEIEQVPEVSRNSLVDTLAVQLSGVMTYIRISAVGLSTYPTLVATKPNATDRNRALKLFFDRFHQIRMEDIAITNDSLAPIQ